VVRELVPEFGNLRIQEHPRLGFVVDKRGEPFYLHQLSDGERGLLALVFDLTRRLAIANQDSEDPIAEGVALVLIDEIELHLHPKWQRDVINRLPSIFRNCQFVITTHSPQVIGEVDARCVRLLSRRDGRAAVDTPSMAYGADSNWILSVLMGAREMNEYVEARLENASHLIRKRELDESKEVIQSLRDDVGNTEAIQHLASTVERIERLGK
jgi:predicted ATP-binding protein involved in virulence